MSFRINTNIDAFGAQRNLALTGMSLSKSIAKLSSGLRINSASDDAAGLSISQKLQAQVSGLNQAVRNSQDGISMVQTTEGALNEVQTILQRMRELGVQGSNGTLSSDDRKAITAELSQLSTEIDRVASVTNFNGIKLLSGTNSTAEVGAGFTASATVTGVTALTANSGSNTMQNASYTAAVTASAGVVSSVAVTIAGTAAETFTITNTAAGTQTINLGNGVTLAFNQGSVSSGNVTFTTGTATAAVITAQNATLQIGAGTSSAEQLTIGVNPSGTKFTGDGTQQTSFSASNFYAAKTIADAVNQVSAMLNNNQNGDVQAAFRALVDSAQQGIQDISAVRGTLGAAQNRLEDTIANLQVAQQNTLASKSQITDVDMAAEMVNFTKQQILQQAGTSILSQANQAPQAVLKLLQ
jgi:flagellin